MASIEQYPPLIPVDQDFATPPLSGIKTIYNQTSFAHGPLTEQVDTVFCRGSTAGLVCPDGQLNFRTRQSDVDLGAVLNNPPRWAGYSISHVRVGEQDREVDVLWFGRDSLNQEVLDPTRNFLHTKFAHPGWGVLNPKEYDQLKAQAIGQLFGRGLAREGLGYSMQVTPSFVAKLALEQTLFVEPWRWQSYQTYFKGGNAQRQIAQLHQASNYVLQGMVETGQAAIIDDRNSVLEPVYSLNRDEIGILNREHMPLLRSRSIGRFVYDQLSILLLSRQGLNMDNGARVVMKALSLMKNPQMSWRLDDTVFA